MNTLIQDIRYALRTLSRSPGLVLVAALSLGLGVGANVTAFSWMEGLVFHPLPGVEDEHRLVRVLWSTQRARGSMSWMDYVDLREATRSLEGMAAFAEGQTELRTGATSGRAWTMFVSGNYFTTLHVRAQLGRTFLPDEERNATPVAVIGHAFWQRRFQGDSAVVGSHVLVNGHDVVIVGVAAPRFGGNVVGLAYEMWFPATIRPLLTGRGRIDHRGFRSYQAVARLASGVSLAQANAEVDAAARHVQAQVGDTLGTGAVVRPYLDDEVTATLRPVFSALLGVTFVVLLVACANVAGLLLARATARRREIGIRVAIGAARGRVIRQLLTESVILAIVAGGVGLLLAVWARDVHEYFIPVGSRPIDVAIGLNGRVLAFGVALSLATAFVFGLAPALRASRPDVIDALKGATGGPHLTRSRTRALLVSGQVAVSLAALVAGGLFVRSLANAQSVDPGFSDPERLLLVDTDFRAARYTDSAAVGVVEHLVERARSLPGVTAVSFTDFVPLGFDGVSTWGGLVLEGYEPPPGQMVLTSAAVVGADYFDAMRVPVLRGRGMTSADGRGAPRVIVMNEAFVRRYWPGQDPIGKWVRFWPGGPPHTVVGIAKDGMYGDLTERRASPFTYIPLAHFPQPDGTLLVRSAGDPSALIEPLRREFAALDANLPFRDPRTMTQQMSAVLYLQRIGAVWLAGFGVVALLLASVGLYGLMSYTVSQRTREVGIRIALGAERGAIVGLIVKGAVRLTVIGLAVGAALGVAAGVLIRSQLLDVGAFDPLSFASAVLLLAAVALAAAWLPARRAARVDPIVALQAE